MQQDANEDNFSPKQSTISTIASRTLLLRRIVQYGFLMVILWTGFQFVRFVSALQAGVDPVVARPPEVEGFLPIGALISLKYWIITGIFNTVHPSALVLFIIILTTGLLLKKGFCSWVCPVGLLMEYLEQLHKRIFRRRLTITPWLDIPLRSLKYLLALFFVWAVLISMDAAALEGFINSPYNTISDVKMLLFFWHITPLAATVIAVLSVLSIIVPYFWCRYLCPYGGLLAFLGLFSPLKIRRIKSTCIDCGKCTAACPPAITVQRLETVECDECHACMNCIDACPVDNTLKFSLTKKHRHLPGWAYAVIIVALFVVGAGVARITGHWQTETTVAEYRHHIERLESGEYSHEAALEQDED